MRHGAGGICLRVEKPVRFIAVRDRAWEARTAVELFVPPTLAADLQYAVRVILAVIVVIERGVVAAGAAVDEKGMPLVIDKERAGIVVRMVPAVAALDREKRCVRFPRRAPYGVAGGLDLCRRQIGKAAF